MALYVEFFFIWQFQGVELSFLRTCHFSLQIDYALKICFHNPFSREMRALVKHFIDKNHEMKFILYAQLLASGRPGPTSPRKVYGMFMFCGTPNELNVFGNLVTLSPGT